MHITLVAKSSTAGTYDVSFSFENSRLMARCACKAGVSGMLCRHLVALLQGDANMLANASQQEQLAEVAGWAMHVGVLDICTTLSAAESEIEEAQNKVRKLRKAILEKVK
jgi:uncharacterized Zn finger protein